MENGSLLPISSEWLALVYNGDNNNSSDFRVFFFPPVSRRRRTEVPGTQAASFPCPRLLPLGPGESVVRDAGRSLPGFEFFLRCFVCVIASDDKSLVCSLFLLIALNFL